MIKVQLNNSQANKINRLGKKYLDIKNNNSSREACRVMRLTINNNNLTVEGVDGYKYFKHETEIGNLSNKDGVLYLPPFGNNFKKSDEIIILEEYPDEIRLTGLKSGDIRVFDKKTDIGYLNTEHLLKEEKPQFEIAIDPQKLKDAMDGFIDEAIVLKFYGKYEALEIDDGTDTRAMLLPVRWT